MQFELMQMTFKNVENRENSKKGILNTFLIKANLSLSEKCPFFLHPGNSEDMRVTQALFTCKQSAGNGIVFPFSFLKSNACRQHF